jgi:hypothetical protein
MKSRERCDATAGLEVRMSKTWRWFVVVAALLMAGGLAGAAWLHLSRPTVLKVAVGPSGFADAELMAAFSRTLSSNRANVLIGPPGADDALLGTLRRHYGVTGDTKALPLSPPSIIASIRDKSVDAVLFVVPTSRASRVAQTWLAVRDASRRKLAFVPIEDAAAIAAMVPAYEAGEIAAGQFGGSPMLPEESVTTLQVATYLVADRNVPNDAITQLIRSLLEYRQKLSADAPIATLIKAASTEKDALFPVHPGAKVYYAGEETSLMERYGDWLFYGPMLFGALGSAGITLARFLRHDAPERPLLPRLITILPAIREARTLSDVDRLRTDIDAAVRTLAAQAPEEERTAVTALTLNYINQVLAERQNLLLAESEPKGETIRFDEDAPMMSK